jgi:hypothetical protein
VEFVWGLVTVERSASSSMNPFSSDGDPVYDANFDAAHPSFQIAAHRFCELLTEKDASHLVMQVESCFMKQLEVWGTKNGTVPCPGLFQIRGHSVVSLSW